MSWSDDWIKRLITPAPPSDYALTYTDDAPIPIEIKDHFQTAQEFCTKMLADYGLDYKVTWGAELNRFVLWQDYEIGHNPGKGWISGTDLLVRWETQAKDLTSLSSSVPIYLWGKETASMERINEKASSQWDISEFQRDPHYWIDVQGKAGPNIWFSVPQWWWCKVEHIAFYEKREHQKVQRGMTNLDIIKNAVDLEVSLDWLSVSEVKERWSVSNYKLEELVRDKGMPSYSLIRDQGIYVIGPDSPPVGLWGSYTFDDRLFNLKEVQAFEDTEAKKKADKRLVPSLNEHRRDRLLARDFSRPWIREDPNIRSGAVVEELKKDPRLKHIHRNETLRGYIADLILNHKSGSNKGPRGTYHKYTK
jgi:hypothetical protein